MATDAQRPGRTRYFALGLVVPVLAALAVADHRLAAASLREQRALTFFFGLSLVATFTSLLGAAAGFAFATRDVSRWRAVLAGATFAISGAVVLAVWPSLVGTGPIYSLFAAWAFTWAFAELLGAPGGGA